MAFSVRPLEDMNEITSHMLEVVQAHMVLGKSHSMVRRVNKTCYEMILLLLNQKSENERIHCPLQEGQDFNHERVATINKVISWCAHVKRFSACSDTVFIVVFVL